jgi:hypothetical protein
MKYCKPRYGSTKPKRTGSNGSWRRSTTTSKLIDRKESAANSPAKPPALPERIEAVLQLREVESRSHTISLGEPPGPPRRSQCHRIIIT